MFSVNGYSFYSKSEYEAALYDKEIIDRLQSAYDISTKNGIEGISKEMLNISFQSKVGRDFDDRIFDLKESIKNGSFVESINNDTNSLNHKSKTGKKDKPLKSRPVSSKPLDEETKKAVIHEIKKQNQRRLVLIISLILISIGSIAYFCKYYADARKIEEESKRFAQLKDPSLASFISVEPILKKTYKEEVVIPEILDEYKALYNKNKSLIGWIKIADTKIDYPVMQTVNNEYYLKHNFDQEEDANGCIFLDCNCDVILGNTNYILYGHHMNNGKMFSGLVKYGNESFYEEHKLIEFDTIYEKGVYEIMYVFRSHIYAADEITFKYYQFIDANSEAEFDSAMEAMAEMSLYDTNVTACYGDRLITLSTCDYQEANGRFVVVAKKIQ